MKVDMDGIETNYHKILPKNVKRKEKYWVSKRNGVATKNEGSHLVIPN